MPHARRLSSEIREQRVERARALARRFERPGVIGAYLFGSLSRPYADESSDTDVQVVVEDDAFDTMTAEALNETHYEAGKKVADLSLISRSELESTVRVLDVARRRVSTAIVLFDNGEIAALRQRLARESAAVRDVRLRVQYYEMTYLANKVKNAERRGTGDTVVILATELAITVATLLFVEAGLFPAPISWLFEELEVAGVPSHITDSVRTLIDEPGARAARSLRASVDAFLLERGVTFIREPEKLWQILFHTVEGDRARSEWGGHAARLG